jgi:hypothetical protein
MACETDLSGTAEKQTAEKQTAGVSQTQLAKAAEKQRLGEALRENLRRRKAQRQGRSGQGLVDQGSAGLVENGPAETAK